MANPWLAFLGFTQTLPRNSSIPHHHLHPRLTPQPTHALGDRRTVQSWGTKTQVSISRLSCRCVVQELPAAGEGREETTAGQGCNSPGL